MEQLTEELDEAHAENKAAIQAQIDDAKIIALQGQLKQASDGQKAKIEKRIAEVKADLEARNAKLQKAG